MDFGLKDKIALVTGSTRGLGKAIAEGLASEGAGVVVTGTKEESAVKTALEISEKYHVETAGFQLDVGNEENVKSVISSLIKKFGRLDILVNNAGVTKDGRLTMMPGSDWETVIRTNLSGAFYCSKIASKQMLRQNSGRIINIASVVGLIGNVGQANYSASKAGLIALTRTSAKELSTRGITVNAIAPGFIRSDMTEVLSRDISEKMLLQIPLGVFGNPEDVADAVLFLSSNKAKYITGQVLNVDGGMVMA